MALVKRKIIRLPDFDYSQNGAYIVTICAKNREKFLWENTVGTAIGRLPLSAYGSITEDSINHVALIYNDVRIDKYVIMPNHIHMIIVIENPDGGRLPMAVPTISRVINQMKGYASKRAGRSLWQPRFYEHVIHNEKDYLDIWQYIDDNPALWTEDEYYHHT